MIEQSEHEQAETRSTFEASITRSNSSLILCLKRKSHFILFFFLFFSSSSFSLLFFHPFSFPPFMTFHDPCNIEFCQLLFIHLHFFVDSMLSRKICPSSHSPFRLKGESFSIRGEKESKRTKRRTSLEKNGEKRESNCKGQRS